MFQKGEYIVYGSTGPCMVMDVTRLSMPGCDKKRKYYVLRPMHSGKSTIYSPVDNQKVTTRQVMTRNEAEDLLSEIPNIEQVEIENEKTREDQYKDIIRNSDLRACIGLLKTLLRKRQIRIAQGRKFTTVDEKYLRETEAMLCSELSIALETEYDSAVEKVHDLI